MNLLKEETYKSKDNVEVQNIYERLCIEETEQQPDNGSFYNQCDQKWTTVKQSIKSSLNAVLPRKADRKKQKWMTDHILNLMENRKQFKNSDKDEYNRLNKQINLACKEANEKWLVNQCEEVEQLEKQYKSREMHYKVKELTSKNTKKKASGCIKDKNGNILFNQEKIAARWVEYLTELYEDHREQMPKFEVTLIVHTHQMIISLHIENFIQPKPLFLKSTMIFSHRWMTVGSQHRLCSTFLLTFDTIDHTILLRRLGNWFGVSGQALDWFKSYFTGRSQRIKLDNCLSSRSDPSFGVPQGVSSWSSAFYSLYHST